MTPLELILITALIASLIFNIISGRQNSKLKGIFLKQDNVLCEMENLSKLLSSSTSNINNLISENIMLKNKIKSLNESKQNLLDVNKGDKVICKQSLVRKTNSHSFSVFYECDVVEATESRLKINAFDFKSDDDWANNNKKAVIDYLQDKWVSRSECEVIIDQQHQRDAKIDDLLN